MANIPTPDEDEYAVYSAILRPRFGDVIVADSTIANAPLYCLDGGRLRRECARRDSSNAALQMWNDYTARNTRRLMLLKRFARDIHVSLAREWKASPHHACGGPMTIQFSRVGFDQSRRFALVTVKTSQGQGPYPECGFASSTTLVYERSRTGWKVRYFIGGSIN